MKFVDLADWQYTLEQRRFGIHESGIDFAVQNAYRPWSITEVDANTIRFEVRNGDQWSIDPSSKQRSEIADTNLIPNGTPIHVSYQFMVEPGLKNTANWLAIGQFHQRDYPGAPAISPPFAIGLHGEKMYVRVDYSDASGSPAYKYLYMDATDIQRGHFYSMDIQIVFDPGGRGKLVVVRDGVTIANYNGPIGYNTQDSVYWKEGIYRASTTETIAAQFRHLTLETGTPIPNGPAVPLDTTPPKASISVSDANLKQGETALVTFAFNEAVVGFSLSDVTTSKGKLTNFAALNEYTYTAVFTPNANFAGTGAIVVNGGSYTDKSYNVGGSAQTTVTIDTTSGIPISLTLTGTSGTDSLKGGAAADTLYGLAGNDQVDGKGGVDTMYGGRGNDLFFVDNPNDLVIEYAGEGDDTVNATVSYVLSANIETLALTGASAINGTGNDTANTINGNNAANTILGMDGADTLRGGGGNDVLNGGLGNDYLAGGEGDDRLIGGGGSDTMNGGTGADLFAFQSLSDFGPTTALDRINDFSSAQADKIDLSTIDANTLSQGKQGFTWIGANAFAGRAGELGYVRLGDGSLMVSGDLNGDKVADFRFLVSGVRSLTAGDFVLSGSETPSDTAGPIAAVSSSDSNLSLGESALVTFSFNEAVSGFSLSDVTASRGQLTNLTAVNDRTYTASFTPDANYTGTGVIMVAAGSYADLAGNPGGAAQISIAISTQPPASPPPQGGIGGSTLTGSSGADVLKGTDADDTMYGLAGNDQMDGKGGVDTMYGGAGNDLFIVGSSRDLVVEYAGEGTDTVNALVSYQLSANIEKLQLSGTSAIDGTGNDTANTINGNDAANALRGMNGADTLRGGGGNDLLDGGDENDFLSGGAGHDTLIGGKGTDILYGGSGADTFTFKTALDFGPTSAPDHIGDFSAAEGDRIDFSALDADVLHSGRQDFTWIGTGAFTGRAGELHYGKAAGGHLMVSADTNADKVADFQLIVTGPTMLNFENFLH